MLYWRAFPAENFCESLKMGTCRMPPQKRRSRGNDDPGSAQEESVLLKRGVLLTATMRQAAYHRRI